MMKKTGIFLTVVILSIFSCMEVLSWGSWGKRKKGYKKACKSQKFCCSAQRSMQCCGRGCCKNRGACCGRGCSQNGGNCCKRGCCQDGQCASETSENKKLKLRKNIDPEHVIDVVICGSGPAGLSAATQTARARVKTIVIEGEIPGGQLMGTTWVENYPGYPSILGPDIIKKLREQAKSFGPVFVQDYVEDIDFSSYPYEVHTKKGKKYYAKTVIIATGVTSSYLGKKGEKEYYGKGVSHCSLSDAPDYKDKEVIVVGGGDSAVEAAKQLSSYAKKVTILVRRDKMRAIASSQEKLKKISNIEILYNNSIQEIIGDGNHVTAVIIQDRLTDNLFTKKISGVFIAIGCNPNVTFVKDALELDEYGYIKVKGATQETFLSGVFAAGDITADKVKLASVAVGSGTQAGFEAVKFLFDNQAIFDQDTLGEKSNKNDEKKPADYKVCFCKGVYYSEIVNAIKQGCKSFEGLRNKLGLCSGCRSCKATIEGILKKELGA